MVEKMASVSYVNLSESSTWKQCNQSEVNFSLQIITITMWFKLKDFGLYQVVYFGLFFIPSCSAITSRKSYRHTNIWKNKQTNVLLSHDVYRKDPNQSNNVAFRVQRFKLSLFSNLLLVLWFMFLFCQSALDLMLKIIINFISVVYFSSKVTCVDHGYHQGEIFSRTRHHSAGVSTKPIGMRQLLLYHKAWLLLLYMLRLEIYRARCIIQSRSPHEAVSWFFIWARCNKNVVSFLGTLVRQLTFVH